jgi:hypothetical protein
MRADPTRTRVGSVILPAHNEAPVIGRCLRTLAELTADGVELVVVANGCTDDTADRARAAAPGATVLETPVASKTHAIRLAEQAATLMPRLYVDADVVVTRRAALETLGALASGAVAARPPIDYHTEGATWPVRRYYRARRAMQSLHRHAWGAGAYGLSSEARRRFAEFPDVVGDDLWVDRMLADGELAVVPTDPVVVMTPRDSANLLRVLRRSQVTKADAAILQQGSARATERTTMRDLVGVARSGPQGAIDAVTYAGFAVASRLIGRRSRGRWERDESSRTPGCVGVVQQEPA